MLPSFASRLPPANRVVWIGRPRQAGTTLAEPPRLPILTRLRRNRQEGSLGCLRGLERRSRTNMQPPGRLSQDRRLPPSPQVERSGKPASAYSHWVTNRAIQKHRQHSYPRIRPTIIRKGVRDELPKAKYIFAGHTFQTPRPSLRNGKGSPRLYWAAPGGILC